MFGEGDLTVKVQTSIKVYSRELNISIFGF